jgi:hypothetical protein
MLNHDDDTNDKRDGESGLLPFMIRHLSALISAVEKMKRTPPHKCFSEMPPPYRVAVILVMFSVTIHHLIKFHDMDKFARFCKALSPEKQHAFFALAVMAIGIVAGAVIGIWFAYRAVRTFVVRNFAKRLSTEETHSIVPLLNTLQISLCVGIIVAGIATRHTMGIHPHLSSALLIASYVFAAAALLTGACKKHALNAAVSGVEGTR